MLIRHSGPKPCLEGPEVVTTGGTGFIGSWVPTSFGLITEDRALQDARAQGDQTLELEAVAVCGFSFLLWGFFVKLSSRADITELSICPGFFCWYVYSWHRTTTVWWTQEFLVLLLCKYLKISTFYSPSKSPVHVLHTYVMSKEAFPLYLWKCILFYGKAFPQSMLHCFQKENTPLTILLTCKWCVITLLLFLPLCVLTPKPHPSILCQGRLCSNSFTVATVLIWKKVWMHVLIL